jgi:hypothetical protein
MKHYETSFVDYIKSLNEYNLHENKKYIFDNLPEDFNELSNLILVGPSGSGKYTQALKIIEKYSDSQLKYEKKINCCYEKQPYIFRLSDIHYEIDISMLGCNCKQLWHELFFQIIDIITQRFEKSNKNAIILCKNFHTINSELLEIFYSYIQHNKINPNINLRFIIITESVSFINYNIINSCIIIKYKRPSISNYNKIFKNKINNKEKSFIERINSVNISNNSIINSIIEEDITNIKDFKYFDLIKSIDEIPKDIFNTITDKLINEIVNFKSSTLLEIRDLLYDMLTYNIDIYECIWYIIYYLIDNNYIDNNNMDNILNKLYIQLKFYNNNYRPIYHLERIIYNIVINIHNI